MKLKKGDNVIITAGKDKGKKGVISRAFPKEGKVIIEGLNVVKKHRRARTTNEKGSIVEVAMPINISNVMLIDPKKNKPTRIGKKLVGDKKVRIAKKSNQEV